MPPRLAELFRALTGLRPDIVQPLAAHGSARRRWRILAGDVSILGTANPNPDENRAFRELSAHLRARSLNVPAVLADAGDGEHYLEEDLGESVLFDRITLRRRGPDVPEEAESLCLLAASELARLQRDGAPGIDTVFLLGRRTFDRRVVLWDFAYCKDCLLRTLGVPFDEDALQDDAEAVASAVLDGAPTLFLHRDFQSRNILVRDRALWFIDFQGAKLGPPAYDLASLCVDARADLPADLRARMVDAYCRVAAAWPHFDERALRRVLPAAQVLRIVQALGAYGLRGFVQGKPSFMAALPFALRNLRAALGAWSPSGGWRALPAIVAALEEKTAPSPLPTTQLAVTVLSFSYRGGYPDDRTGHGGGFVFDCRLLPNPGRDPELAPLTGRDPTVADRLREDPRTQSFLAHVRDILAGTVVEYQKRGYTSLSVAFGCTGGRHRSVFCAERVAAWLSDLPGVAVRVEHRDAPES